MGADRERLHRILRETRGLPPRADGAKSCHISLEEGFRGLVLVTKEKGAAKFCGPKPALAGGMWGLYHVQLCPAVNERLAPARSRITLRISSGHDHNGPGAPSPTRARSLDFLWSVVAQRSMWALNCVAVRSPPHDAPLMCDEIASLITSLQPQARCRLPGTALPRPRTASRGVSKLPR